MPSVKVVLFRSNLADGSGNTYPVFTGFLPATTLKELSLVPAFSSETTHSDIGKNVDSNPVEKWQRPEIAGKIQAISSRFSVAGEVMPNPVLLASLVPLLPRILHTADDGTQTVEVELGVTPESLIVLDGQHRIKGLAKLSEHRHIVPFVLLADVGSQSYNRSMFARIFAEVTTQSSELDKLHDAWLKYAFQLDNFEPNGVPPSNTSDHHSMATVTHLVAWSPAPPIMNPFLDKIRLNPVRPVSAPMHSGFAYDAVSLAAIAKEGYFANPARVTSLSPATVGEQIGAAVVALSQVCTTALDRSVFFGGSEYRQRPMEDAFLLGVLHALAVHGTPTSWRTLLETLKFDSANWNFKTWVARLDGNTGGRSRALAKRVLTQAFGARALPAGVTDIPTHLKGDGAELALTFHQVGPSGRVLPSTAVAQRFPVSRMGVHSFSVSGDHKVSLAGVTSNIERVVTWDVASPRDELTRSKLEHQGLVLNKPAGDARELRFKVEYYGGVEEVFKLALNW